MRRCSRASSTNTRHGSSKSSNPDRTVWLNRVERFDSIKLSGSASAGLGGLAPTKLSDLVLTNPNGLVRPV